MESSDLAVQAVCLLIWNTAQGTYHSDFKVLMTRLIWMQHTSDTILNWQVRCLFLRDISFSVAKGNQD